MISNVLYIAEEFFFFLVQQKNIISGKDIILFFSLNTLMTQSLQKNPYNRIKGGK